MHYLIHGILLSRDTRYELRESIKNAFEWFDTKKE